MRILVTNYALKGFLGTETYVYTLACQLMRVGHEVVVYSPHLGEMAERIRKEGTRVVDNLRCISEEAIDVIHGHHKGPTLIAFSFFPSVPIVYISHGVLDRVLPFEGPPAPPVRVQLFVAVSEEVKENLVRRFGKPEQDIIIVRNAVDTERFQPRRHIGKVLKDVLWISNDPNPEVRETVRRACARLSLNLKIIGRAGRIVWNVEDYINEADLVISLGRGVIEGMACGRAVIVYGPYGADGIVTADNIDELQKVNFSGRRYERRYKVEALVGELRKYDQEMGESNRQMALERFDAQKQVKQLLGVYKRALERSPKEIGLSRGEELQLLREYLREMGEQTLAFWQAERELERIYASRTWKLVSFLKRFRESLERLLLRRKSL